MINLDAISNDLEKGGRILVTRLQYLGDVVLTLPLVQVLRCSFPKSEIDYLTKASGAELLEGEPLFANVYTVPQRGFFEAVRLVRTLRRRNYVLAVDLLANPRSAVLTYLSGAKARVGGAKRVRRFLYNHQISVPENVRAATHFHLHHLTPLGIKVEDQKPELHITKEERERAKNLASSICTRPASKEERALRIGIHPGGKWEVKRWPAAYFAELAASLKKKTGADIYVLSGPGEDEHVQKLKANLEVEAAFVPVLPIRETAALIEQLDCLVVCDGGIMHVSVAVGTPTVGIFGSSEPDVWFPYESFGPFFPLAHPIECRPCHLHACSHLSCLCGITVENVEAKVMAALESGRRAKGLPQKSTAG
jgi:ADP-heptose:LPS heptosyltransferase